MLVMLYHTTELRQAMELHQAMEVRLEQGEVVHRPRVELCAVDSPHGWNSPSSLSPLKSTAQLQPEVVSKSSLEPKPEVVSSDRPAPHGSRYL